MKTAIRRKAKRHAGFEDEYRSSLREYTTGGGETALGAGVRTRPSSAPRAKEPGGDSFRCITKRLLALVREAESEKRREELLGFQRGIPRGMLVSF